MKNSDWCHLHVHNEFSQLDGFGTADNYAKKAKQLGFKYLGLTNHANIDGLIKFQKSCEKEKIKPILGCEFYIVDKLEKKKRRGHIVLFAKNQQGFENICRMLTFANTEGFYYRPRITFDLLKDNCKGNVITTACPSTFLKSDGGVELFDDLNDLISDDLYLELMPHNYDAQIETNKLALNVADKTGRKVIVSNDCHYINRDEYKVQEILLAMQRKVKWNDPKRWKFDIRGLHLKTFKEMRMTFKEQGFYKSEWFRNTLEIAEKCSSFKIEKRDIKLPRIKGISTIREKKYLQKICEENFYKKFKKHLSEDQRYVERFKEEFDLINSKKFTRYFLIVWELIDWCKKNKILVGPGRGSVGGSLIAFLMNITTVDPILHDLLFSRFINEDRIDYPDIDIDFEHTKRHLVKKHLEEIYGQNKVAGVSSFNRMKARAVIRNVSRVFEIPNGEVDRFSKLIEDNDENTGIQDAIDNYEEGKEFNEKYPSIIKYSKKLEGQVSGYSQHAAALVISQDDIGNSGRCNLLERDGVTLINWEKDDTEYVGLMKLDSLSLKLLSTIGETLKLIEKNHRKNIELEKINLNDKDVLKEIDQGHTVGIFQMGTWATTALIKEMGISDFTHMSDAVALVRPGPTNSGITRDYIKRKHGARWKKKHKIYEKIMKDTYGLPIYQEQIMSVIKEVAGLPYSTADKIRKIIGKKRDKKEFKAYEKQFLEGCQKEKIFDKEEAKEFWRELQEWAKYGFPKAHSVGYAILAYWCAWLKKYYPTEFICASLTYGADNKKGELVEEAYRLGLTLVLPKVTISSPDKWVATGNKLYIPFKEVKGIGDKKAVEAAQETNKKGINKFFTKKSERLAPKHKGKFGELLESIDAYNPDENTAITEQMQQLFKFRIVTNPRDNYKNLYNLFNNKLRLDKLDDVLAGDYRTLKTFAPKGLIHKQEQYEYPQKLLRCESCELFKECTRPVPPSGGELNVMIIGQDPGFDEDREGQGFVGRSGREIWKLVESKGYRREQFHVTNICKCYPSISKKGNADQIKTCTNLYLKDELLTVKPKVVLAYGNANIQFFMNRGSGIIDLSGRTTWNEEYTTWIAWCLHTAAVLHNPDNKSYYEAGMKNFFKLLYFLGLRGIR